MEPLPPFGNQCNEATEKMMALCVCFVFMPEFHWHQGDPVKAIGSEEEIMEKFMEVKGMIKNYSKIFIGDNF